MAQTYARLTGDLWLDPGLAAVNDEAFRLYVLAISYSAQQLSDGFVPHNVSYMLTSSLNEPLGAQPWQPLIKAGLWLEVEGGYQIKGYLKHNKSKAEIEAARARNAERVTKHRETKGSRVTPPSGNGDVTHYSGVSNTPIEEELELEEELKIKTLGRADARPSEPDRFEEFYAAYPRKVKPDAARRAWRSALKRATAQQIIDGVLRFAADPNLPEKQYIPHPSSWLNAGSWNDEPLPPRETPKGQPPPFRPTVVAAKCPEHPRMTEPCATCASERAAGIRKDTA